MDKEEKDMIEPIKNWDYTYRYDGSRTSGKSYYQELLDQKQQELDKYKNIVDELEKYFIDMFNRTQDTKYLDDLSKLKELKGDDKL